MRRFALLLLLSGCGWDTSDLNESTHPNKVLYCTRLAEQTPTGVYDNDIYLRCMHGDARSVGDAGTRD